MYARFSFLAIFTFFLTAPVSAQQESVSMTFLDAPLDSALTEFSRQTQQDIAYSDKLVENIRVSCSFEDFSIEQALEALLRRTPITFKITDEGQIVLVRQTSTQDRVSIYGIILDAETGLPLSYVNVFLANTMMGAATNPDGEFRIDGVPAGTFNLVASRLGYEVAITELMVTGPLDKPMQLELTPKPYQTPEIEISAERMNKWQEDFRRFKRLLFSTTANAGECFIKNSHVLEFSEKRHGLFVVTAYEPLIIENYALGYKLYYVLEEFSASKHLITMRGFARFEKLKAANAEEGDKWRRGRLRAYNGSLKHFLATLCQDYGMPGTRKPSNKKNMLENTGFSVSIIKSPWERRDKRKLRKSSRVLKPAETSDKLSLAFSDYLLVNYRNEVADQSYLDYEGSAQFSRQQESIIRLTTESVLIDTSGNVYDSNGLRVDQCGIRTSGYWSWERVADKLPWDYTAASAQADERALERKQLN